MWRLLAPPLLVLFSVQDTPVLEKENSEARLFRAETRARFARVLVERFAEPVDAWIMTGGPGKAVGDPDAKPPPPPAWFLLLIECKPRVAGILIEYRFCIDVTLRRRTCWSEENGGEAPPGHEPMGCCYPEDLKTHTTRLRDQLVDYMVDDLARQTLPEFYNQFPPFGRLSAEDDTRILDYKRTLIEGRAHLYTLVDEQYPTEKAAVKENLFY